MTRYELGMSLDYPANWTAIDAIREIFQNALDEETQNPDNRWYFNYDKDKSILRIGNKLSKLNRKTLLLGVSSKRDDEKTIGKHGEGYKVGINVLLREGFNVTVYNYSESEVWHAKTIKSRRYNTDIAVFDIERFIFRSVPEQSLIFEVEGVSEELYSKVKENNLWLQDSLGETKECGKLGKVLLNPKFKGKIFVKGLYVCTRDFLTWGYDLAPELIKLDRDRSLIDSFDLQYTLGKVISESRDADFIDKAKDLNDGQYIRYAYSNSAIEEVCDRAYNRYTSKYGKHSIPCSNQEDFNKLQQHGYNAVMLSNNEYYYVTNSSSYKGLNDVDIDNLPSVADKLEEWVNKVMKYIPKEHRTEGNQILMTIKQNLMQ